MHGVLGRQRDEAKPRHDGCLSPDTLQNFDGSAGITSSYMYPIARDHLSIYGQGEALLMPHFPAAVPDWPKSPHPNYMHSYQARPGVAWRFGLRLLYTQGTNVFAKSLFSLDCFHSHSYLHRLRPDLRRLRYRPLTPSLGDPPATSYDRLSIRVFDSYSKRRILSRES